MLDTGRLITLEPLSPSSNQIRQTLSTAESVNLQASTGLTSTVADLHQHQLPQKLDETMSVW